MKQPYSASINSIIADSNSKNSLKVLDLLHEFVNEHKGKFERSDHNIKDDKEYNHWILYVR